MSNAGRPVTRPTSTPKPRCTGRSSARWSSVSSAWSLGAIIGAARVRLRLRRLASSCPIVVAVFAGWAGLVYGGGRGPEVEHETMTIYGEPQDGSSDRPPENDPRAP